MSKGNHIHPVVIARRRRKMRDQLLKELYSIAEGVAGNSVDAQEAGRRCVPPVDPMDVQQIVDILADCDGYINGRGRGDRRSRNEMYSVQLTPAGIRHAEYLFASWPQRVWEDHSPTIVAGVFGIVGTLLGAVVGAWLIY